MPETETTNDAPSARRKTIKIHGIYGVLPLGIIVNHEISSGAKVYFSFLFSVSFTNDGVSWYSQEKAAEILGLSRWSIMRYALELKKNGLIDRVKRDRLYYTRLRIETFGETICSKSATYKVADLQHGMLQICHTNDSKEGDQMNENGVGLPREVPHRPDPSSIIDCASKASKLSREAKDKIARKKFAREQEISTSGTLPLDRWRGTAFYKYLMALCAKHSIPVGDVIEHSKSPPERYAHVMNEVLASCESRQLSKQDLAHMFEGLTSEWKCGASGSFSKDGKLSVYALRNKIDRLVSMYGPKVASVPEIPIEGMKPIFVDKNEDPVKKEDCA